MEFRYGLNIAGLHFLIKCPFPVTLPECFQPFMMAGEPPAGADVTVSVRIGAPEPTPGCAAREFRLSRGRSIFRLEPENAPERIELYIPSDFRDRLAEGANWLLYLALERPLLRFGRVIMHASAVVYGGRAYVFTAPSGGGKSTQACIWEKYLHAEVMNGDKVILHGGAAGLTAYGGPVAGSSGIYKSISAPVAAIVQLEKGDKNEITPLSPRESYLLVYGEAVKSDWDTDFNRQLLRIAADYPQQADYVRLRCTADRCAAECLLQYFSKKESRIITR